MFNVTVLTPNRVLFEGEAWSVFLPGTTGEFEILEFHKSIVSLLKTGRIIIDWDREIPIRKGAMRMSDDVFVAIVEE